MEVFTKLLYLVALAGLFFEFSMGCLNLVTIDVFYVRYGSDTIIFCDDDCEHDEPLVYSYMV